MLRVTRDLMLPTAITESYPRPLWFTDGLHGRSFKSAMGESIFREQYLDAVACVINAQEAAGLDIVTDGDSRFDLAVGGKSWFFYPIERLGGIEGHRDTSRGWMQRHGLRSGKSRRPISPAWSRADSPEDRSSTPRSGRWPSVSPTGPSSSAPSALPPSPACCGTSTTVTRRP